MIAELVVDLGAIRTNVERLRALVRPARFAAVVKANAYGHGLVPVARAIADLVDKFCVYGADEALALREAGITKPILVMGPTEAHDLPEILAANAAITLWEAAHFRREVAQIARARDRRFPVHVKIETGVARLGFDPRMASGAIAVLAADEDLEVRGVYTHLAAAEELESSFTLGQLKTFRDALQPVDSLLREHHIIRHAAASAAAMLFPALRLDLVRVGIATYGIWPSPETCNAGGHSLALAPALTWTTPLVAVRDIAAGQSVGYGCSYHTTRASRIAILPIGYAEGIPRALSSTGTALVHGKRAPFVGRVCMNMIFVDVTDVPEAHVGSQATLLGQDGNDRIDPNEQATLAGTIGYELVARLPPEVPRRYVGYEPGAKTPSSAIASARSSVPS
jgi:alanine racemase